MPPKKSRTNTGVWTAIRKQVINVAKREGLTHCPLCGVLLDWSTHRAPNSVQVDHIIPHALGGEDSYENARAICAACNRKLGRITQSKIYAARRAARERRRNVKPEVLKTSTDW